MKLSDLISRWNKQNDSPPELAQESHEPEVPPNSTIILEEINYAEIEGYPETSFKSQERVYLGEDGQKCKITIKKNPQAAGCGHNLKSPDDVGFISHISKLPVCKICEQEYYRLRDQTRHENCVCRHLVAPHELSYLEGKGFVCEECKRQAKAIKPLKVLGWIFNLLLKSLITENPQAKEEVPNDFIQLPPPRNLPPISHDPIPRP